MFWSTVVPLFAHAPYPGYALGWGTLSLINAGLAQSKNHSGLVWWLLSLLLGPIATFLIVAVLDPRPVYVGKVDTSERLF